MNSQCRQYVIAVEECGDWEEDPWVLHAVEFKGVHGVFLMTSSGTAESTDPPCPSKLKKLLLRENDFQDMGPEGYATIQGRIVSFAAFATKPMERKALRRDPQTLLNKYAEGGLARSLGFVGSDILAYESAQHLRKSLASGPSSLVEYQRALLCDVASPGPNSHASKGKLALTLLPAKNVRLVRDICNNSQMDAIQQVREGLSIIHGLPGTGKSFTILNLINTRIPEDSKVLVTCARNQAIEAVIEKVAGRKGGALVFGSEKSLGEIAKKYTMQVI